MLFSQMDTDVQSWAGERGGSLPPPGSYSPHKFKSSVLAGCFPT